LSCGSRKSTIAGRWLILDADQIQSNRRRCGACRRARACVQNLQHVGRFNRALACEHECAYQISHHMVQKSISTHGVYELIALSFPLGTENAPHVRDFFVASAFGIDCRERGEIMLAHNRGRCQLHRSFLEWVRVMPNVACQKGWADRAPIHPITIALGPCRLARMKFWGHLCSVKYTN